MRGLVVGLVLLATGCGGQDWAGLYSGAATLSAACSDGSSTTVTQPSQLSLNQTGDDLSFITSCGVIAHATVHGGTATLVPFDCPQTTAADGNIVNKSFPIGTLKLSGDKLTTNLTSTTQVRGSGSNRASCNSVEIGSLTLVP